MGAVQAAAIAGGLTGVSFDQPLRDARDAFEKAYLEYQLEKHAGNVSQMAEEAGMERTHLYRKLRDRGIEIKDRRSACDAGDQVSGRPPGCVSSPHSVSARPRTTGYGLEAAAGAGPGSGAGVQDPTGHAER